MEVWQMKMKLRVIQESVSVFLMTMIMVLMVIWNPLLGCAAYLLTGTVFALCCIGEEKKVKVVIAFMWLVIEWVALYALYKEAMKK